MSYGTIRTADVNISDIDIYVHYTNTRGSVDSTTRVFKIDNPSNILTKNTVTETNEEVEGLYSITLNPEYFNEKGVYSILIKPKKVIGRIADVSVLSAQPNIRGIVFNISDINDEDRYRFNNDNLVGYRVEYFSQDVNETKINNIFRIITSNNLSEPVIQNLTNNNDRSVKYRFNDSGTLVFCTVTPSAPHSTTPNILPFIGEVNQKVALYNTFFDPIMLEVEFVDYDTEDIAIGLFGNQSKSLEDGILTQYNFDNEIYKQFNLYEIKETYNDTPLYEVKEGREEIDSSKNFDNINNLNE